MQGGIALVESGPHQDAPTDQRKGSKLPIAKVAELVDALVLGASGATRGSSSLPFRTISGAGRVWFGLSKQKSEGQSINDRDE